MYFALTARIPATVAAFAVALMGLLPDAHMHTSGDHRMVHRHVISEATTDYHSSAVEYNGSRHGRHDHADARTLTSAINIGGQFAGVEGPVVGPWFLAGPDPVKPPPVSGKTLLPTHDPPLRFTSSPAPPAVV